MLMLVLADPNIAVLETGTVQNQQSQAEKIVSTIGTIFLTALPFFKPQSAKQQQIIAPPTTSTAAPASADTSGTAGISRNVLILAVASAVIGGAALIAAFTRRK